MTAVLVSQEGGVITVTGSGFQPGEMVTATMYSDPQIIGTKAADASGKVTFTWTPRPGTPTGSHTVVLVGAQSGQVNLTVTLASLPTTGAAINDTSVGVTVGCLLLGLCLLTAAGIRRRSELL